MLLSRLHLINKRYYVKKNTGKTRKVVRFSGLGLFLTGILLGGYFFFPFISWKMYLEPVFASQMVTAPIPQTTIITSDYIQGLWLSTARSIQQITNQNSSEWIPASPFSASHVDSQLTYYFLSIPKLKIENAVVTTIDTDLSRHLVNFPGTAVPPARGNAAVFGHSTLPPLFDPSNYKTIFANLHTLSVGDTLMVNANKSVFNYRIFSITVVEADETSYLSQESDNSYLTLITCTPPGTLWKRLIIKSKLENI